jgi:hypothetical protein
MAKAKVVKLKLKSCPPHPNPDAILAVIEWDRGKEDAIEAAYHFVDVCVDYLVRKRSVHSSQALAKIIKKIKALPGNDEDVATYKAVVNRLTDSRCSTRGIDEPSLFRASEHEMHYVDHSDCDYPQGGDEAEGRSAKEARERAYEEAKETADEAAKAAHEAASEAAREAAKEVYKEAYEKAYREAVIKVLADRVS